MTDHKWMAIPLLALALLGLTGCGETLEQRAENKRICEEAGGVYSETISGWTYEYSGWNCDLSTKENR